MIAQQPSRLGNLRAAVASTAAARTTARPLARQRPAVPFSVLALIQLSIGYEFLVSGVNKLLAGTFPQQNAAFLGAIAQGNGLYSALVAPLAPFGELLGLAIMLGELGAGVAAIGGLLVWLFADRLAPRVRVASGALVGLALLGAALLSLNIYLALGAASPLPQAGRAFGSAVTVELLLVPLALAAALGNLQALARAR